MNEDDARQAPDGPGDEDFAEAWEHGDDLDVGADTSQFETFQGNDTAELLRRKVRGGEDPDAVPDLPEQQDPDDGTSGGPPTGVVVGVLVVVFVIMAVLYLLG